MKTVNKNIRTLLVVSFLFLSPVIYADDDSIDCTIKQPYSGEVFKEFYKRTVETAGIFCKEFMLSRINRDDPDNTRIRSLLEKYADDSKDALDKKELSKAAEYNDQFKDLKSEFAKFDFKDISLPEFIVESKITSSEIQGYFQPPDNQRFTINQVNECDVIAQGKSCVEIFEEFQSAFNPYRSAYNNVFDTKNTELLANLTRQWDKFLEVSKSQTFLEVMLTTYLNRSHFKKNYLVGPPSYQVIAIHPQLVYSHFKDAPDGDSDKMGLAVEWIGVNAWDWKIPVGISYTSTYIDSAQFKNTGGGVMLHFYNHYGIGWSDHGNEDIFYVTIDLLKLFEDKKTQYERYLSNYYN